MTLLFVLDTHEHLDFDSLPVFVGRSSLSMRAVLLLLVNLTMDGDL